MMTDNLLEFLNEIQKFAVKIKIQETINSLIKDDRVHNIINADVVLEYYEKMHEHFDKDPQDFLFPNHEWLDESLERLNIDLSDDFDESANPDQIKDDALEEKERHNIIIPRNTKFVVREMSGYMLVSNKQVEEYYHHFDLINNLNIRQPIEVSHREDGSVEYMQKRFVIPPLNYELDKETINNYKPKFNLLKEDL